LLQNLELKVIGENEEVKRVKMPKENFPPTGCDIVRINIVMKRLQTHESNPGLLRRVE